LEAAFEESKLSPLGLQEQRDRSKRDLWPYTPHPSLHKLALPVIEKDGATVAQSGFVDGTLPAQKAHIKPTSRSDLTRLRQHPDKIFSSNPFRIPALHRRLRVYRLGRMSAMRVATFNANSIRVRLDAILDWLAEYDPDVLAVQETKVDDRQFPHTAFEEAGYHVAFHGQKTYNGVALISKAPLQQVRRGMMDSSWPADKRVLAATIDGVRIINTYVPNGTKVGSDKFDYKLRWFEQFRTELISELNANSKTIWLGDINVAPTEDDVFDHAKNFNGVCHHPDEMERLASIVELGLVDCFRKFTQGPGHYSYWEFFIPKAFERNLGWRIDHIYASSGLVALCQRCEIDRTPRSLERPSDHTFVYADFDV